MFEAYKVGITIALTNKASSALAMIGKDLVATDLKAAKLNATLKQIKTLGVAGAILGGAGLIGLRALDKSYEAAKKYEQALNQFKAINLGDVVNKDADRFARGANVIGASATDLIETVRDLHMAFNDYGMAKALAPQIAQMKYANQAVFGEHGMDMNRAQLQAMEKIIEMKGGFRSPDAFMAQANMMQKVISGTGGMVKPSDFLNFIKTAGVSGRLLSNEMFYYTMEPLIQEMTGHKVGTGTMSAYNNLAQGRSTVRAAKEMMKLGILNPSMVEYDKIGQVKRIQPGALLGMDEYTSNPYQWMKEVLVPHMATNGITAEKDVLNEMGAIYGNRTGSNLFSLMYLQQEKIEKNMAISKKAMDVDALLKLAKSSPQGAEAAIGKAWENLRIAAGESLIPIVIPALLKLAEVFRALGQWIALHPVRFDWLIKGFAGLSAALLFSGTVLTLKAAFMGLSLVTNFMRADIIKTASAFGMMSLALGTLAAAAAVFTAAYYHKEIADKINETSWGKWIGDKLFNAYDWTRNQQSKNARETDSIWSPPPKSNPTQAPGIVYLDGHPVGKIVAGHMANSMNGPATGGNGFDSRQSYVPVGVSGSW